MKKKSKNKIVKDITHLRELCTTGQKNYAILLNGGVFSRKTIKYYPQTLGLDRFKITNHIDNTKQDLNRLEILDKEYSNIGEAMEKHSLIAIIE